MSTPQRALLTLLVAVGLAILLLYHRWSHRFRARARLLEQHGPEAIGLDMESVLPIEVGPYRRHCRTWIQELAPGLFGWEPDPAGPWITGTGTDCIYTLHTEHYTFRAVAFHIAPTQTHSYPAGFRLQCGIDTEPEHLVSDPNYQRTAHQLRAQFTATILKHIRELVIQSTPWF